MERKLMLLLIWLAFQCNPYTASAQSQGNCDQPGCTPIMEGQMCISNDMDNCCPARCAFNHAGNTRASYNIHSIIYPNTAASTCSERFMNVLEEGYSSAKVTADPVGNACPLFGTCHLYQCVNIVSQGADHVFINEDYVTTIQTVTNSQSLSALFNTNSPTTQPSSTHLAIDSTSPNTQQINTHLTLFPSSTIPLTTITYNSKNDAILSSQMPPTLASNVDDNHRLYVMLVGVLTAGLLCVVSIALAIACLILLRRRGARIPDKPRVVESCKNKCVEDSQSIQHTSANTSSHHFETLPAKNNVHALAQPTSALLQQKPTSSGYTNSFWSCQPDETDTFTRGNIDSNQVVLTSEKSVIEPDRTDGITTHHPATPKPFVSGCNSYENVDLAHEEEDDCLQLGQERAKVPQKQQVSLKVKSPKKTMRPERDFVNTSMPPNSYSKNVYVITGSERIFHEKNKAYLSNLTCEQVLQLLDSLSLEVYKPIFEQGRITGDLLAKFDERTLEEGMGITSIPARIKFLKLIAGQYSAEELLFQGFAYEQESY